MIRSKKLLDIALNIDQFLFQVPTLLMNTSNFSYQLLTLLFVMSDYQRWRTIIVTKYLLSNFIYRNESSRYTVKILLFLSHNKIIVVDLNICNKELNECYIEFCKSQYGGKYIRLSKYFGITVDNYCENASTCKWLQFFLIFIFLPPKRIFYCSSLFFHTIVLVRKKATNTDIVYKMYFFPIFFQTLKMLKGTVGTTNKAEEGEKKTRFSYKRLYDLVVFLENRYRSRDTQSSYRHNADSPNMKSRIREWKKRWMEANLRESFTVKPFDRAFPRWGRASFTLGSLKSQIKRCKRAPNQKPFRMIPAERERESQLIFNK
ncbi:LOW QUALITY PROTEIN: hypothetical protein V1478_010431 [Vespula squamosa]|uniref:Uncharacterized protein n=1 Tax=Vespula squamosa TaxID=30214 RepID=A0ABD2AI09_VESSQ